MALSALRSLSDAVDLTRALLFPLSPRRWGVLAAVVAFLGPAGTPLPATPQVVDPRLWESLPAAGTIPRRTTAALPEVLVSSLLVGVGALGVLLVGYLAAGSLMHYVFVERLHRPQTTIRDTARHHRNRALGLFVLRVIIWAFGLLPAGMLALAWLDVVIPVIYPSPLALVVAGVGVALAWVLDAITCQLAVPVSIAADTSIVAAWRQLSVVVRAHPIEYLAYAVVRPVVSVAVGVAAALAIAIGVGAVVVLVGTLSGGILLVGGLTPVSRLVLAGLGSFGGAIALVIAAVVSVPFHVYLRYYALLVIGTTAPPLDLVTDQRAGANGARPSDPA